MRFDVDTLSRFHAKYKIDPKTHCWVWIGGLNHYGYGHFMVRYPKRMVRANRVSYELFKGKIPPKKMVLHKCDNRACVNPKHLVLGTQFDNMQQALNRGRFCVGTAHWCTKLTEIDVRKIRADPRLQKIIAAQYAISQSQVSDIKRRRYWRHVM